MAMQALPFPQPNCLNRILIITRREMKDNWQDWRIMLPIVILTFIFPFLMDFTSRWATRWVTHLGGYTLLAERVNPFLLMVVGFFPLSFALVIALESFVGEKERNSLEALLSTPVSDLELYLSKMLSSLLLPLLASYVGITIFLTSRLLWPPVWVPPLELVVLVFLLNTVEATVMVAGAVIISSQTTSIRAANLLASFIIIPMALLVQGMSVVMFYATYEVLGWIGAVLLVVNLILIRWGMRIFNREEILAKETDRSGWRRIWHDFKGYFLGSPDVPSQVKAGFSLSRLYRHDLPLLLKQHSLPFGVVVLVTALAVILGAILAQQYPLPPQALSLDKISARPAGIHQEIKFGLELSTPFIFFNNLRTVSLAGLLSIFSFGTIALFFAFINIGLVSFIITQIASLGYNPWLFTAAFILPHEILEIPAFLLGITFALRIGATLIAPPSGLNPGQALLLSTSNFIKILIFLVIPLFLLAAFIEANITPQIVLAIYAK